MEDTLTHYEWLLGVPEAARARLHAQARPVEVAPSVLLFEGDACRAVTLLASGRVRVSKRRASGRMISLYTVERGELCVLEALAVLSGRPFRAEAAVESTVTGVAVPADLFRGLFGTEPGFRDAVLATFEARLATTLELVGDIALESLEARLATLLLRRSRGPTGVVVTHEQLARELACAREAVSRILEHWEHRGYLRLGRGHIVVLAPERLAARAPDEARTTKDSRP